MILDIIFGAVYFGTVGLYSRYFFYKLIGKGKPLSYLRGLDMDRLKGDTQRLYNFIFGMIVGSLIIIFIAYLVFS